MKKRIVSAIIMMIICIPLVIIGGIPFRIGISLIAILAYKEVLDIKGFNKYPKLVEILGLFIILLLTFSNRDLLNDTIGLNYRYLAVSFLVMFLPTIFFFDKNSYTTKDAFELTSFILFLGLVFNLISNILIYEKPYFFLIILVTIFTDTFAYFIGSMVGRHKFTKISPNKTIEGCLGGIIMGTALTTIYYMTFIGAEPLIKVIPVLMILSLICEMGDLFYSAIKRERGIKDFSNLIPGHGGILDRIDSITFVTFAYVLLKGFI